MPLEYYKTQVLLLHSQQSTLDTLSSGFNDRYSVHCATSGSEALSTLGVTPIHVIVSAQDLPGMSGLEALREARKRSPDTIGILLAGRDQSDGLEALVSDKEVFQIVRGEITPEALRSLIDTATRSARLMMLAESANDTAANVDEPMGEHIVMETSENGATIISDGTGTMPALKPQKIQLGGDLGSRGIDILVLTKDEEFLATIKDSARGLHKVLHAVTPAQAEACFNNHKIGVLVTDAAMVGSNIELITQRLRSFVPRLVAIVAGRRDDGDLLMDLINRGHVYRFLLKPVSPGRARLAIEASVKHHLEAPENAFKPGAGKAPLAPVAKPAPRPRPQLKAAPEPKPKPEPTPVAKPAPRPEQRNPAPKPVSRPETKPVSRPETRPETRPVSRPAPKPAGKQARPSVPAAPQRKTPTISASPVSDGLDDAFGNDSSFTETMTGLAASIGKSLAGGMKKSPAETAAAGTTVKPAALPGLPAVLAKPKLLAAAGAVLLLVAGVWMFSGSESDDEAATVADTDVVAPAEDTVVPRIVESGVPKQPAVGPTIVARPTYADLLDEARIARDAGEFIRPAGSSAIELYVAAREAAPGDVVIASELTDVVNSVLGLAESALLAGSSLEAEDAIRMVRMATPDNPRLPFLDAQLSQLQYRNALDNARIAMRETRFEDAATFLANAQSIAVPDKSEVAVLKDELARSRSEQRVDEVLAIAAQRLEQDRLTSPANDNARYYYELALSNDASNAAAQQGLVFVASKLVLKARAAIDNGELDQAAGFLEDATELDPKSSELAASTLALQNARQAQIDAARRAESERLAAIEREKEAARQAELDRQAEAERSAEAERMAAEQRESEARRQAAAALAAGAVAASPSTGPAAPGGSTQSGTLTAGEPESGALQTAEPGTDNPLQASNTGDNDAAVTSLPSSSDASAPEQAVAASSAGAGADAADSGASGAAQEPPLVGVNVLTRLHYESPKYPRSAMRRGVTGYVDLNMTIARDGSVYNVIVLSAEPESTFDEAAIQAVSQWKFQPVIEAGVPVERRTAVRMAFELE